MNDQSLRAALRDLRSDLDRSYPARAQYDIPSTVIDRLDVVLAVHAAEPAPVVTDEAVEAAAMAVSLDWEKYTASMRTALKAAAPLLGPRPLLDADEVSSWIVEAAVQFAGSSGSADACHDAVKPAVDGVMKLARPMPTQEQIEQTVTEVAAATGLAAYFKSGSLTDPSDLDEFTHAFDALLNGAGS